MAWKHGALAAALAAAVIVNPALADTPPADQTSPVSGVPGLTVLGGQTPALVVGGQAISLGPRNPADTLAVDLVLPLRNQAALDDFTQNHVPQGEVMTHDQVAALFYPDQAQVAAASGWAAQHGLTVSAVSPDRTLVTVRGSIGAIDAALGIQINNYRSLSGLSFFSADRDPAVPASLGLLAVSGLNNLHRFHVLQSRAPAPLARSRAATALTSPYKPINFRGAYDMQGHDGSGQTIGFTLWGTSVAQSDLNTFHANTGDATIVAGQSGANGIDWLFPTPGITPAYYGTDALLETAMDVEYAHAMAGNAHLKYFLGDEDLSTCGAGGCSPTDVGLENAVAAAAADTSLHVVSNSWGGGEPTSVNDSFFTSTKQSFQTAMAAGTTFYFSSGDSGSDSGGTGLPSYPADSPYVVSVGGTSLNLDTSSAFISESGWSGSGGGCSTFSGNTRPSWQTWTGTNASPSCSGRAEPDVAADADPNTGAYVYVQGSATQVGGTSLAAPLWSGMTASADSYAVGGGHAPLAFTGPVIYKCANNQVPYPTTCRNTYHDVTSGNNGAFSAGTGWDQVTGWGSINWWSWVQAVVGSGGPAPTPTNTNTPGGPTATNTPIAPTATRTNTPVAPAATNTPSPACGSDGTCLTGFTASATTVPAGTSVTLTASANRDVGPTPWYIDIADETGAIRAACASGTSCVASVSSAAAASHTFTAYLATSSSSVAGPGARSGGIAVTWTGGAPISTNTPVPPTATRTNTPIGPTATRTNTPAAPTATRTNTPEAPTATNTPAPSCGSDGTCLTGFTASATSVAAGTSVTLTAFANRDIGPTVWYTDIADETGAVRAACASGTSCVASVSSAVAASHTFTAYLATSSRSVAGPGARSGSIAVTWTGAGAPTSTNTPVPPTATPSGSSSVTNGGFESGLSGWTTGGVSLPVSSTAQHHSGSASALLGVVSGAEPNGDSSFFQTITVPNTASPTLTFWYRPNSADSITYDWQEAQIRNTSGTTLAQVLKVCSNTGTWTQVTFGLSPYRGQTIQIYFNVREDGYGDLTSMYLDDISVS